MGMMGGMGGMGMTFYDENGDPISDPAIRKEIQDKIDGFKETLKNWNKFKKDELIPPEIIDSYNQTMEDQGMDYYIKRSLTLDFDADYRATMQYFYDIEFARRINTINNIVINNKEHDVVNVQIDVEGHFVKNLEDDAEEATESAPQIGLN